MTHIEVDQSSKLETPHDTILAYSNSRQSAIRIPSQAKRDILNHLRQQGKSNLRAVIWLFAAALFLLLRDVLEDVSRVTIDLEYYGYEADIKSTLLRLARNHGLNVEAEVITFAAVGKNSNAHLLAIGALRGQFKVDHVVTANELRALLGERKRGSGGA